jgi:hypothetical protein
VRGLVWPWQHVQRLHFDGAPGRGGGRSVLGKQQLDGGAGGGGVP